jgi:hypothetical protein
MRQALVRTLYKDLPRFGPRRKQLGFFLKLRSVKLFLIPVFEGTFDRGSAGHFVDNVYNIGKRLIQIDGKAGTSGLASPCITQTAQ